MYEAVASAVQLQGEKQYGFPSKSDVRATVLPALDSRDFEEFLIANDFSKQDRLVNVAKSRNHKFKTKGIRNNMTLIKSNPGKIHCLSKRMSQILLTHKNLWEGIQKEKLNQGIIAKIEKDKAKDVTKKFLEDYKLWGRPFTTVNTCEHTFHRRPELQEFIIETEITYYVKAHKSEVIWT